MTNSPTPAENSRQPILASAEGASDRITAAVTAWPGVESGYGRRGEFAFKLGGKEIGHIHGEHSAHFFFPRDVFDELFAAGRVGHHPVFPDRHGPAARRIDTQSDVADVIELMRLNYDRVVAASEARSAA